jgi:Cu-processing system permease protein
MLAKYLSEITWIAHNTFRSAIRDKILYNLAFMSCVMVVFSMILGEWSVFDKGSVIQSFSLMIMAWSGVIIAIFVGIMSIQKEIQRRTIYTLLAKPISRNSFLVGKFVGLALILIIQCLSLAALTQTVLWFNGIAINFYFFEAVLLIYFQQLIVLGFAVLFCSFSTPVMSGLFTAGMYFVGHLTNELLSYIKTMKQFNVAELSTFQIQMYEWIIQGLYNIMPNLGRMTISSSVIYGQGVSLEYIGLCALQTFIYSALCLTIATLWFNKRDFI